MFGLGVVALVVFFIFFLFVYFGFYSLLSAVCCFMVASSMGFCCLSGNREINMMMMTKCGRLFQRWLLATRKAWSPTVMSRVHQISNDDDERSRRRLSLATRWK